MLNNSVNITIDKYVKINKFVHETFMFGHVSINTNVDFLVYYNVYD